MRLLACVVTLSACAGAKSVSQPQPQAQPEAKSGRPCPDGLTERLHALFNSEGYEAEETAIVQCLEGRFGAPGWGVLATHGQAADNTQGEMGWSHYLVVVGEDGAVRAHSHVGGSGWMYGAWQPELTLADFDADGVDELIFTDRDNLEEERSDPMQTVEAVVIHRFTGTATEEKLRLRVDVSDEDVTASEEDQAETPVFTCKSTWKVVDGPSGTKRLEVVTTTEYRDPRRRDPEEPETEAPTEELRRRYQCPEPGTRQWQVVSGNFSEAQRP